MPGATTKKNLYLGKSLSDLNNFCAVKDLGSNVKLLVKSAEKTFQEAVRQDDLGDEERAYVLYMKYFNVIQQAKTKPDYKKQKEYYDSLLGSKNQMKAIVRAEQLSQNLKERYDLIEAELVAKKLSALEADVDDDGKKKENKETEEVEEKAQKENGGSISDGSKEKKKENESSISPTGLYNLMRDKDTQLLIMDVRTVTEYAQSHIDDSNCINVPTDIVPPGTTCRLIERDLPGESKPLWLKRGNVDHIVLLDWNSTIDTATVGTTLKTLKDALFKFDSTFILKSEPLILEGGYSNWHLHYPMKTTNPHIDRPKPTSHDPLALLDFDYPELEDEPDSKPEPKKPVKQTPSIENVSKNDGFPQIDRSTKPKFERSSSNTSQKNGEGKSEVTLNNIKDTNSSESVSKIEVGSRNNLYPSVSGVSSNGGIVGSVKNVNLTKDLNRNRQPEQKPQNKEVPVDVPKSPGPAPSNEVSKSNLSELEGERQKLESLAQMRRKQEKDVADLMRLKRDLQEEMKMERQLLEDRKKKEVEEEELRLIEANKQKDEAALRAQREEVERLRQERKLNVEKKAGDDKDREAKEEEERAKKEEKMKEEEEAAMTAAKQAEQVEKERQQQILKERQKRIEMERRKEKERLAEEKRMEEEKRQREEKERIENERILQEKQKAKQAQIDADKARAKLEAEKAKQVAEEKIGRIKAQQSQQPKVYQSLGLPVGWEKRLDRNTNRYYYIDHNKGLTQFEPPQINRTPTKGIYTTKIKEEPDTPSSGGLKKSFSSPDIMKLMEQEDAKPATPVINRSVKPTPRPDPRTYIKAPVKRRDLNPTYGNVGAGLTGLRNLGNTCYMNSTIQCLNHTTPLVSYFLSDIYERDINRSSFLGMNGEVVDEFAVVVKALWSGQYRCITPRDLKNTIGKYNPMFSGYEQHDSQEFLTFLLDGLHEGLNEVKHRPQIPDQNNDNLSDKRAAELAWENHNKLNRSVIVSLFQGQLKSTVQCKTCGKESVTFEAFMYLSLPIPDKSRCSLKDCIERFLRPEMMTGSSRYKCTACRVPRDAVKRIEIWKLPPVLLIGLNRFVSGGMWMEKKTTYVDYGITDINFSDSVIGPRPKPYNLYAVSNHYGTMEGGHYTAYGRNPSTRKWYKYDDHEVYEISSSDVKSSAGYLLFYASIELPIPQYKPQLR